VHVEMLPQASTAPWDLATKDYNRRRWILFLRNGCSPAKLLSH
jgi:hypothetical protein